MFSLFFVVVFVGFIAVFFFISRKMSGNILKGTSATYLNLAGVMGEGKILGIKDTGTNVANTYFIYDCEIEITSLNPSVKTKAQGSFLKNKIPNIGDMVKVKYDPKDPKVALISA